MSSVVALSLVFPFKIWMVPSSGFYVLLWGSYFLWKPPTKFTSGITPLLTWGHTSDECLTIEHIPQNLACCTFPPRVIYFTREVKSYKWDFNLRTSWELDAIIELALVLKCWEFSAIVKISLRASVGLLSARAPSAATVIVALSQNSKPKYNYWIKSWSEIWWWGKWAHSRL